MKTTRTITIDMEVWREAMKRTDNISGTINDMLIQFNKIPIIEMEMSEKKQLKDELLAKSIEMAELQKELQNLKKKESKKKEKIIYSGEKFGI